jgi:tRNA threonylcarbamoyl adenosine modification protein YeaZ
VSAQNRNLILALDAGSPLVSVALGVAGVPQVVRAVPQERSSTQLLALVAEALDLLDASPADLAGVVALAGPGSFTGLRVALATALGLHQALAAGGLRAHALPTLRAMAVAISASASTSATASISATTSASASASASAPPGAVVVAAVDALRGEWSAQPFRAGAAAEPLGPMELLPADELLRRCVGVPRTGPPPRDEADARATSSTAATAATAATSSAWPTWPVGTDVTLVAFGVAALEAVALEAAAAPNHPASVHFLESPALAPAALRLAAALAPEDWHAATLGAPLYSRAPATTPPRPRPIAGAPAPLRR